MFDHIGFGVSDYEASKAFFPQGAPTAWRLRRHGRAFWHRARQNNQPSWMHQSTQTLAPLHLAFAATNRKQVDEFYRAALQAGGKDKGAPGIRPHYHANYYGAFVIGPDGHNVEAVCHRPEA